jgi:hypothetical protein
MPLCLWSFALFARPCVRLPSHRYALPYRACTIAEPCHAVLMLIPTPHHTTPHHTTPHTDDPVPSAQLSIHSTSLLESPLLQLRYTPPQLHPQSTNQTIPTKLYQTKATPITCISTTNSSMQHTYHPPTSPLPFPFPFSFRSLHRTYLTSLPPVSSPYTQPRFSTATPASRRVRLADLGGSALSALTLLLPCTLHLPCTLPSLPSLPVSYFPFPVPIHSQIIQDRIGQDRAGQDRTG